MKIDQNPFSLYDFLGYFIPGAILLYFAYLMPYFNESFSLFESLNSVAIGNVQAYLPFIILSYVIGHVQNFISSYTIERFCIWRYSYPFRFLMDFYHEGYINVKAQKFNTILKRTVLFFIILPISFWDFVVGTVFKLKYLRNKKFSDHTKEIINLKLLQVIQAELEGKTSIDMKDPDNFLLIYHYTLERSKNHVTKFTNYVALYGFARSISFIITIIFWFVLYQNILYSHWSFSHISTLFLLSIGAYIFFLNFCKFYRRYSMEVIMTFISLE